MKRYLFATALAVLVVVLPGRDAIRASGPSYAVEDLGEIGGFVPLVTGMNASGQVSGYINTDSGPRAVRYTNGVGWEYLPGLGTESYAMAINDSGDVAGYHVLGGANRAFRYTNGTGVTETINLPTGSTLAFGYAINADGVVAGYGDFSGAILGWRAAPGGDPVALPTLGGPFAVACGINDAGQVVGSSLTAEGAQHAYRVEADNSVTAIVPFDGPTGTSSACAIDAAGRVGGWATSASGERAFRFVSGAPVSLDPFAGKSSIVAGIANGVSAGWFTTTAGVDHAFVHSDANGSTSLNDLIPADSGWHLEQALAVNTAGHIVGHGKRLNNVRRVFRLTPVGQPADTTAPVISSVSATPSTVWPPNGELVPVTVAVEKDDDAAVCSLTTLTASAPTADGSVITGPLTATVRAVGGLTYTLTATCTDAAGNTSAPASTDVVVPPDTTAPVISHVRATPDAIWPPNGKMVAVTVSVSATDDVDGTPQCYLVSVSGGGSNDAVKTGRFTANVRSEKNADGSVRVYSLNVKCRDNAGNKSAGVATVVVGKDSGAVNAFFRARSSNR